MLEEARRDPPLSGSPDTDDSRKSFELEYLLTGKFTSLKIQTLCQANMTLEEGARGDPPSSTAPDTYDFRKKFESVYLEKQQISLAENSKLEPGEHNHGSGGTTGNPV